MRLKAKILMAFLCLWLVSGMAAAQTPEQATLKLGVGGKPLLYYLPLTIAERKGFFQAEGLNVEIIDLAAGSRALQSLIGGSVDVVTGAYEHTLRMQQKGQDITAVIELGRFPGIVVAVRQDLADKVKSPADFKGLKVGVSAPGSSTALTAQYAMVKSGIAASDAAIIGIGSGASSVAAIKQRQVDVISHTDPIITRLEADGDIRVLVDTRTESGTRSLFGGSNPAAVLYTKADFIKKNPNTMQALVTAFAKTLDWINAASPEDIAAALPEEYYLGDRAIYVDAVKKSKSSYSITGIINRPAMESVVQMLKSLDPDFANFNADFDRTFDPRFINKVRK